MIWDYHIRYSAYCFNQGCQKERYFRASFITIETLNKSKLGEDIHHV